MKNSLAILTALAALIVLLSGCMEERKETPTKGRVTVVAAETVAPVIQQEKEKFEEIYPQAHVELVTASTREAVVRFFNDSIKVIVTSRPLNAEERAVAAKAGVELGEYKIAIDGIAFLVNVENPLTGLRTTQLDSILSGSITRWDDLGDRKLKGPIELCLPSRNSGAYEIVAAKVLHGRQYAGAAEVAPTSAEMLRFVVQHPNGLGMIGMNWLTDHKDEVKALELADPNAPDSLGVKGQYFQPHQAYVYQQYYPVTRDIFIYSRADAYSVGNGFTAFVTSAPGQKIILNSGLVPATMPVRLVQLTSKGLHQ